MDETRGMELTTIMLDWVVVKVSCCVHDFVAKMMAEMDSHSLTFASEQFSRDIFLPARSRLHFYTLRVHPDGCS